MEKIDVSDCKVGRDAILQEIKDYLQFYYQLNDAQLLASTMAVVSGYFEKLHPDLCAILEYPYVDKVYRDSYYGYFSSKNKPYFRDSIKVSFFKEKIDRSVFFDSARCKELLPKNALGFMTIRPTFPLVIGRSLLSPLCSVNERLLCSMVKYQFTTDSVKLEVEGFPHSGQDKETITCAETTILSIMEYFGNRYPEYRPALPSRVTSILGRFSAERLLPSNGLTATQISYALKELGFGVKIYSKGAFDSEKSADAKITDDSKSSGKEFYRIVRTYVESGIPIVGIVSDRHTAHAVNIIGRKDFSDSDVEQLVSTGGRDIGQERTVYDFADMNLEYVFMDDNTAPYQCSQIEGPLQYSTNEKLKDCKLNFIIVPLYPKIYMDAGGARKAGLELLKHTKAVINKQLVVRVMLASSRSYKDYIALNGTMDSSVKCFILERPMPKFIWVMELSTKELCVERKANGLILFDATEPNETNVICSVTEKRTFAAQFETALDIELEPFNIYDRNLRSN